MKILALDTATEACSAALLLDGKIFERYQLAPREHNRLILPMIEGLLAEAGKSLASLDALAFGRGPGSFTGVRIATGVAQGLAFGADLQVAPVSTLAALAQEAFDETGDEYAFPCIDARMGEVYWGVYRRSDDGHVELVGEETVTPADHVSFPDVAKGSGIGSGWATYREMLTDRLGEARLTGILADRFPRAGCIARLGASLFRKGGAVSAELAQPVYLRDKVAKKPGEAANAG
ncbi:tRNA (adenosine(37)-N6)-threonylcarbamoyltransferase complex dimerization subunit type 1 TsaB [Methylococcus sp. EFPC2]|uniref:tRNA (adenosine(37)-N6)-threonylcarbamoyltransferase complex dimerization subunit type 1 TsaB n=1 Tax=Methylococcus sp. EFPC2 TaxID=2812648 RepID=UPI0019681CEC|nr:tRNA (adenosine(37)-N6)-threonylcarbamoyltransferase complex dimerization subunit type 1 TsaB [Methylococcus sp. EFPC2]QSA98032.1 tRNA (adenosine(37)-N6)-threonylcarbamoyltransferase complex dimerization subunit type 1 TsaB [Methylococcus sp. EFPC2]